MQMYDLIYKKRQGEALTPAEIAYFVQGYTKGDIADYQASALLMAIYFRGMNREEIFALTKAMRDSGDRLDLSRFGKLAVDKHSTGGVGDKTTMIVAPIVAAAGLKVAKMSGRGLGHTGGTIDKLESVPGYRVELSKGEFLNQVDKIGIAVVGQSANLAPADKKIYSLRDVTATVESVALIASSIMSKKLAAGAQGIVLDVKVGSGALMPTMEDSRILAETMVDIGKACGVRTCAMLSNMDVPLGTHIGNALEMMEALEVLQGKRSGSLRNLSMALAAGMIAMGRDFSLMEGKAVAEEMLENGKALDKFKQWLLYQGGSVEWFENGLPLSTKYPVYAKQNGYLTAMDSTKLGHLATAMGAGRMELNDRIDYGAGIVLCKTQGDYVSEGDLLAELYTQKHDRMEEFFQTFHQALYYESCPPKESPLIYEVIQ